MTTAALDTAQTPAEQEIGAQERDMHAQTGNDALFRLRRFDALNWGIERRREKKDGTPRARVEPVTACASSALRKTNAPRARGAGAKVASKDAPFLDNSTADVALLSAKPGTEA